MNTPPEQWADFIANETIKDPARLLRIEQVFVDLTGLFDGVLDSALSNLVENGTTGILEIQGMFKRPGDKFTLTIRVWSQEYFAGTNPLDASSHVRISAASAAGRVRLTFQAMAGRSYSIEYLDGLGAGQWNRLTNVAPQAADYLAEVPDTLPPGATGRFYRLVTPRLP